MGLFKKKTNVFNTPPPKMNKNCNTCSHCEHRKHIVEFNKNVEQLAINVEKLEAVVKHVVSERNYTETDIKLREASRRLAIGVIEAKGGSGIPASPELYINNTKHVARNVLMLLAGESV